MYDFQFLLQNLEEADRSLDVEVINKLLRQNKGLNVRVSTTARYKPPCLNGKVQNDSFIAMSTNQKLISMVWQGEAVVSPVLPVQLQRSDLRSSHSDISTSLKGLASTTAEKTRRRHI
jgi:hypothetical protein